LILSSIGFGFYIGLLNYNNIYKDNYFDNFIINNSTIVTKYSNEIRNIYFSQFNNVNIFFSDVKYHLIDLKSFNKILEIDKTNEMPYKNEINDCDDFSIILAGNINKLKFMYKNIRLNILIGVVFGTDNNIGHSFNLILTYDIKNSSNLTFYCLEPQEDKIFDCYEKNYNINYVFF